MRAGAETYDGVVGAPYHTGADGLEEPGLCRGAIGAHEAIFTSCGQEISSWSINS